MASGARTAYGLLRAAIRDENPVVVLEPRALYGQREDVSLGPDGLIPLGTAEALTKGDEVTIVTLGRMVPTTVEAMADNDVSAEIINLRTLIPWDRDRVLSSIARTGRLVTVEESPRSGGWGTEIVSEVAGQAFRDLHGPILRITAPNVPVPFSKTLEERYAPTVAEIRRQVEHLVQTDKVPEPWWVMDGCRSMTSPIRRREEIYDDRVKCLERLIEIRHFEDRVQELFAGGAVHGTTHLAKGQEAVAVAIARATRPTDTVTCTYRGHAVALALGMTPDSVIADLLGRESGCIGGVGGSMHLSDSSIGLLPTFAIVGAGIPVAVGAALTAQTLSQDRLAVAVFGDGATNIGAFHEALNIASVWTLPVLFVCENNHFGEYSRINLTTPFEDLARRAQAYGIEARTLDGQDVDVATAGLVSAVKAIRNGHGPQFAELKTYRYSGHSRSDTAPYRDPEELARWLARDPIDICAHASSTKKR